MHRSERIGPLTLSLTESSGHWTVSHHQDGEPDTHIEVFGNYWCALATFRRWVRYAHDWLAYLEHSAGDNLGC